MDQFPTIYRVATGLYRRLIFPFRGGIRGIGMERVPSEGGMILAAIHVSSLDPPALAATLKKRRLRAFAKEELWKNKLFGAIIEGIGAFPVKRGSGDSESIRKCISILQGGEAVIVFPEGTRNDGVTMNPLQPGVAMLAKKANVPVVPAGISGTSKGSKGRTVVVYGDPIRYEEFAGGGSEKESRQRFLQELEARIQALCAEAGLALKIAPAETRSSAYRSPEQRIAIPESE